MQGERGAHAEFHSAAIQDRQRTGQTEADGTRIRVRGSPKRVEHAQKALVRS